MQQLHVCNYDVVCRCVSEHVVAHDTNNVLLLACRTLVAVLGCGASAAVWQQGNLCGQVTCQSAYRNMNLGQQAR